MNIAWLGIGVYAVTAVIGAGELLFGDRFPGLTRWPFHGAKLRIVGAWTVLASLLAVALAMTGDQGFAFLVFGAMALVVWALAGAPTRSRAGG